MKLLLISMLVLCESGLATRRSDEGQKDKTGVTSAARGKAELDGTVDASKPADPSKPAALRVGKLRADRILFLGNSITLHGPAPQIGWTGEWGMAASAKDKDYVHQLFERVAKATGGRPQVKVRNIAEFERGLETFKIGEKLKDELAFEADIVVIAIGENAQSPKTDEARKQFAAALDDLLAEVKRHGSPTIFVRSQYWPDAEKDGLLKSACTKAGGVFVDIAKLGGDPTNFARAERKIEHAGVAGHPGDKGMQALAEALWEAIKRAGE